MPVNVNEGTTAPKPVQQTPVEEAYFLPLLAHPPHFNRDFLVGGFTINAASVPLADGKRLAYPGDVFRRNDATGLWDLAAQGDDGAGSGYVMLPHTRDCTSGNQSANGLLHSRHVNKDVLRRPIPAALVGAGKPFSYHIASPVDTRG